VPVIPVLVYSSFLGLFVLLLTVISKKVSEPKRRFANPADHPFILHHKQTETSAGNWIVLLVFIIPVLK
jgi:hypothetical protein